MDKNLRHCLEKYQKLNLQKENARKEFLTEAFRHRKEYMIPEFLWTAIEEAGISTFTTAWVDYRHGGAFISIFGVRPPKKDSMNITYFITGWENMEYSQDHVDDMETYDFDDVAYFIEQFLLEEWDEKLAKLSTTIIEAENSGQDMAEAIDKAVKDATGLYLSNYINIDIVMQNIIAWAHGYEASIMPEEFTAVQPQISEAEQYLIPTMPGRR